MVPKLLLIPLLLFVSVYGLPQGAPPSACQSMIPFHGGGIQPRSDIPPYSVLARRQGGQVLVTITSSLGVRFQGFMLQARTVSRELLGEFDASSISDGRLVDCGEPGDTVTHKDPQEKGSLEVVWRPPQDFEGPVIFNATVAQSYDTFWVGVESPQVLVTKRHVQDDPPFDIHDHHHHPSPTPPYFTPRAEKETHMHDPFYEGCEINKLCFGAPAGCVNTRNCKAAVAVTVFGEQYDFEMKAENAAWVGVGLSDDEKMGDDSVIECVKRGGGVAAYMSWTSGAPNYGAARLQNPQLGIRLLNGSVVDGTLYCRVRRDGVTNIRGRIFDMLHDQYNLLIASGSGVNPQSVSFHDLTFLASGEKRSLADVSAVAAASRLLIRLHGCFMLAAWIGTASLGLLLARYYRQTWVGTALCGKDLWFAYHRMFMILTWALTMVAFVLIFVELKAWSSENNPHAILGTVTTILCFFQPIGAYFRPHPGTSKRPIFNWLHWFFGNAAHIIAIVTLFFAVQLTKAELPEFVDWILVAYVVFYVVTHLILSVMGCISEKSSESRVTSFPMKDLGTGRNSVYSDQSIDAPFSGFRKCILAIYIVIVLAIVIALIVITALAPIEETWSNFRSKVMKK